MKKRLPTVRLTNWCTQNLNLPRLRVESVWSTHRNLFMELKRLGDKVGDTLPRLVSSIDYSVDSNFIRALSTSDLLSSEGKIFRREENR